MAANQKETAEQKLLKMIEVAGPDGTPSITQTPQRAARKQNVLTVIKMVNIFLIVVLVILAGLIANDVKGGTELMNRPLDFASERGSVKSTAKADSLMPAVQRISYYLASVEKRNFFQPYEVALESAQNPVASTHLNQMSSKLKLVGISWLDTIDSASVMIEDTDKGKTFFLRKGEKIEDSNITIKTIYADSAVLGYENEEMTIRYDKSQM